MANPRVQTPAPVANRTFRVYAGGRNDQSGFRDPSPNEARIHAECVLATFSMQIGEGSPAIVRVVKAKTEREADRCWSTPQAPQGARQNGSRYYRADIMVAQVGNQYWVKGGTETDLLTQFAPVLQRAYVDGKGDNAPDLKWAETIHTFGSDGNRCHWLVATPKTPLDLKDLCQFVEENASLIVRKDTQAENSAASQPETEGFELVTGGYNLPVRFHFVGIGEDVTQWRVGDCTAQILVISCGRGKEATRWIKIQRGVNGAQALLTLIRAYDRGWEGGPTPDGGAELRGREGQSFISIQQLKELFTSPQCPLHTGGGFAGR